MTLSSQNVIQSMNKPMNHGNSSIHFVINKKYKKNTKKMNPSYGYFFMSYLNIYDILIYYVGKLSLLACSVL